MGQFLIEFQALAEACRGPDAEGAKIASLVLDRCHEPPQRKEAKVEADRKLELAIEIIESCGSLLTMNQLSQEMAKRDAEENETAGEPAQQQEQMRNFPRKEVKDRLRPYARKTDPNNPRSPWIFEALI